MSQIQHPDLPLPNYFSQFANAYVKQTGHSTLNILTDTIKTVVQKSANPIGPDSIIHDTAAGPAIGAAALIAALSQDELPKKLVTSDNTPAMIKAAEDSLAGSPLKDIENKVLDSQSLEGIPDNYFTHSINNFSIFAFTKPGDVVKETYRTLQPGGLAVITTWRRFAPMFIVHAAQRKVRPDVPDSDLMPTPSPEFYEEGVLAKLVAESGFSKENINVVDKILIVKEEENLAGVIALMSGPFMARARTGYTDEETAKWPEAVSQAVKEECEKYGGIRFEAYVLLATK